jgi:hypothetical protein
MPDRMQQSRFELKYLLTEAQALRVRDFVGHHIGLDEHSAKQPDLSYPVHSLYLDSDDLVTYWHTINGDRNRFKLRIRYYDSDPGSPVFFEIKRRVNHCIKKQRGGVRNEMVRSLLGGYHPEPQHLLSRSARQMVALQRFCELMQQIHAKPKVHIAYEREAYVSDDDSYRVTLDRRIRAEARLDGVIRTRMSDPVYTFPDTVVLELKFTNRFPNFYRELVQLLHVMQCGAAKYVEGVHGVGPQALRCACSVAEGHPARLSIPPGGPFLGAPPPTRRLPSWLEAGELD